MNRINKLRNLALAIGLAGLCGFFGCSSPAGPSSGQQEDELQHSHFVRVDGVGGDNAPSGYAAGPGPATKELSANLGPSPEPWADDDSNRKGPSPEPWHASSIPDDDGSGGSGSGTGTGSSGSSGNASSSSSGNPNPNAAAANNK